MTNPIFDKAAANRDDITIGADSISDSDEAAKRAEILSANTQYPEVPEDSIPPIARTVGYVAAATFAVLSPFALGLPAVIAPDVAGQVALVWGMLGTAVTGYAGFVGVKYRPTK